MSNEHNHPAACNACGLCTVKLDNIRVVRGQSVLLDGVSFDLHCGELTALIGVNGAGKTTLLRSILGEIRHEGTVSYESVTGDKISHIVTGYVPQYLEFDRSTPISVLDFLRCGQSNSPVWMPSRKKENKSIEEILTYTHCLDLKDKMLGDLSGGELQRVMLAQALHPTPQLLILDEPVSGVDTVGSEYFYEIINEVCATYHIAIIMVSHDLRLVKAHADKVLLLNKHILTAGTSEAVFASKEFQQEFGGGFDGNVL